jgi:hypothetical protein
MYNDTLVHGQDRSKAGSGSSARCLDDLISDLFAGQKAGKPLEQGDQAPLPCGRVSDESLEEKRSEQLGAEFIGRLAQEFELMVQRGLLRNRAIASVIDWASAECLRSSRRPEMKNSE